MAGGVFPNLQIYWQENVTGMIKWMIEYCLMSNYTISEKNKVRNYCETPKGRNRGKISLSCLITNLTYLLTIVSKFYGYRKFSLSKALCFLLQQKSCYFLSQFEDGFNPLLC